MKVLIVSPTENILTNRGTRFPDVAREISKMYDVTFLSTAFRHSDKSVISKRSIDELNLPYRLRLFRIGTYKYNIGLRRILWNLHFASCIYLYVRRNRDWDRILVPNRPPEIVFFLMKALGPSKYKKIVIDILDIWPEAIPFENNIKVRLFYAYCNWFNNYIFSHDIAMISYVSKSFLPWYQKKLLGRISLTPTTFVPLGLSDQQKRLLLDKSQFNLKLTERGSKEKLIAVFAGTISEQFDLVDLLERNEVLLQSLDKIILIGNVSKGEFYSNLDKWLNDKGIRYEDYGELSKTEYVKVLKSADVALFNMKMSGMPKKVWDYSLCGLPIIIPKEKSIDLNIAGINSIEIEDFTPDLYKEALKQMDYKTYEKLLKSDNIERLINSLV